MSRFYAVTVMASKLVLVEVADGVADPIAAALDIAGRRAFDGDCDEAEVTDGELSGENLERYRRHADLKVLL